MKVLIILIVAMAALLVANQAMALEKNGSVTFNNHALSAYATWHHNSSNQGHITNIDATFWDGSGWTVQMRIVRFSAWTAIGWTDLTTRYVNGPAMSHWTPNYTFIFNINYGQYAQIQVKFNGSAWMGVISLY